MFKIDNIFFITPLIMLIISTFTDIKIRKIKNYITYPMILSGLLAGFFNAGINGLAQSFIALFTAGMILAIIPGFFSGGGDIKLAAGCGAWLGSFYPTMQFIFLSMLFVFIAIVAHTILSKGLGFLLKRLKDEIYQIITAILTMNIRILTKGGYKDGPQESVYISLPMAPFMLIAYSFIVLNLV